MHGNIAVKGFVESSFVDWPGKVAAVLFLPGCNFRCPFCHNRDLVLSPDIFEDIPLETVSSGIRENDGWLDGVVVTGGEPAINPALVPLLEDLREAGLPVKLDTNGSRPDVIKSLIERELIDAVAMDVKAPLEAGIYTKAAGVSINIELIRESIKVLAGSGLEVTFRTTAVPGLHDIEGIRAIQKALMGRPLTLQNFRPPSSHATLDPLFSGIRSFTAEEFDALKECTVSGTGV